MTDLSTPFPAWPPHGELEERLLLDVLHSGKWGSNIGNVVNEFEQKFARVQGAKHGIALTNGTMALVAGLKASGVGLGDEVIVPPYTFIATAAAALFVGAVPVFADVDPVSHLLDPAAAEAAITERTKAIIPVHLAGNVADMTAFAELGRKHGLTIIEDAAQAAGAQWEGHGVGTLGDMGTFSFQSSKNLTAGEGGCVVTDDEELANKVFSTVNVGRVRGGGWYEHRSVGFNLRLTEFQGAILLAQLERFEELQALRDRNARHLRDRLRGVEGFSVAEPDPRVTAHGQHLFIFRVPELGKRGLRDEAVKVLAQKGVPGPSGGYVPLHRNEALLRDTAEVCRRLGQPVPEWNCPNTDLVTSDTIWFIQSVLLGTPEQMDAVADVIIETVREVGAQG